MINLEQLCDGGNNYDDVKLQIEIWDYEENGNNRLVGKLKEEMTLTQLMNRKAQKGNADRRNALEIVEVEDDENNPRPAGLLVVLMADMME
jgi:hypothetical protein